MGGQPIVGHPVAKLAPVTASQLGLHLEDYAPPIEWIKDWTRSIGVTLEDWLSRPWVKDEKLYLLKSNGVAAVTGCTGYQYTFKRELLADLPPLSKGLGVGPEDLQWHQAADDRGYLNLNTVKRFTHHLGNNLDHLDCLLLEEHGMKVPRSAEWRIRRKKLLIPVRTVVRRIPGLSRIVRFFYQRLRQFN